MSEIEKRPLVTLAMMTYQHERFLREALQGALAQTYHPLEIIVSDDASTDGTWSVVQEVARAYQGSHRLIIRRNDVNLGINRHFNELMTLVKGEYVVIAAGDDVSFSDRVARSIELMQGSGRMGVHGNAVRVNADGRKTGLMHLMDAQHNRPVGWEQMLQLGTHGVAGATLAWHRKVNDTFGPIPESPLGEDAFIPFRCALLTGMAYTPEALVFYRSHAGNVSFWKKLEAGERNHTGKMRYRHRIGVLRCWRNDVLVSYEKGCLDESSCQRALHLLDEQIRLHADLEQSMEISLLRFMTLVWRRCRAYSAISHPVQLMLEGYLVNTHLNLYRLLHIRRWPTRLRAKFVK